MKARTFYIFIFICILTAMMGAWTHPSAATPLPSAKAAAEPVKIAGTPPVPPATAPPSKPNPSVNPAVGKDVCLGCHGPFNDLAAAPTTFTAENGDKVNPHRYVPHDRTDDKAVVECTKCHSPHPVPLTSKPGLPKGKQDWCYSCHHTQEFFPCKNCHQ